MRHNKTLSGVVPAHRGLFASLGFLFYLCGIVKPLKRFIMTSDNSNILSAIVDGISIDYQRESNNCRVNLTKMAKPFGKRVIDWLNLPSTKEYLTLLQDIVSDVRKSNNVEPLIVTKQGGNVVETVQGTWATDYRIAMRFAQWLSPEFSIKVDELLVKIVSGELMISGIGVMIDTKGQTWISRARFCKALGVSEHSFNGLMSTYKQHFAQIGGFWYVSSELFKLRSVQQYIDSRKNEVKKTAPDVTQLSLNFE